MTFSFIFIFISFFFNFEKNKTKKKFVNFFKCKIENVKIKILKIKSTFNLKYETPNWWWFCGWSLIDFSLWSWQRCPWWTWLLAALWKISNYHLERANVKKKPCERIQKKSQPEWRMSLQQLQHWQVHLNMNGPEWKVVTHKERERFEQSVRWGRNVRVRMAGNMLVTRKKLPLVF